MSDDGLIIVGDGINPDGNREAWIANLYVEPAPEPVAINIRPLSRNNIVDWRLSRGVLPVAILSSPGFNAPKQVDRTSLTFGRTGTEPSFVFCLPSIDVNRDGRGDLICAFCQEYTDFQCGDTEGLLRGQKKDGTLIEGHDSVKVVPCR